MTVLSDSDIMQLIDVGKLGIEPFCETNLTPNGYDLTVDEVLIKSTDTHISKGIAVIPGHAWFVVSTKEFVRMGADIASQLWIRSSYARKGIMASFGKVDAGFHGTLTISCFNANECAVELPIGDRFCQIVFEQLSSIPKALYAERSGTYQNQRGVTLCR
ncbi:MAG: dCTP deaminase [Candidatus Thermoplasmatota archaeon]|nr:dCTP deaminase [Candidatus Thermoplasmatota archaeon]MBU1941597.1 dCTP deaminase [Candidatus Thermoplasmatota archaeon]